MSKIIISQNLQESPLQNTNSGTPVQNGTTTPKTPGEHALMYATRFAWRVFPVAPRTKNPLINDWPNKATTNTDQIEDWWARWPSANIGLATGGGLLVADFDGEEGLKLLAKLNGHAHTPTVRTSKGKHLYYQVSPENEAQLRNYVGVYHGLDFRTKGGYVLLPPSVHESGVRYGWEVRPDVPLLDAPALLLLPKTQRRWLGSTLANAENGNRNNSGFGLACQLRDNNVVKGDAKRVMEIYQQMVDDPTDPYTIDEALRTLDSAYNSSKREPAAVYSLERRGQIVTDPGMEPPLTDQGNAERLIRDHGKDIRYCRELGWFTWDGKCWALDQDSVHYRAQITARSLLRRAADTDNEDFRTSLVKWAMVTESAPRNRAMVEMASRRPEARIDTAQIDADHWLLNVANGVIDLRRGLARAERRREDYITHLIDIEYDPEAECPEWLKFLARITDNDQALVTFLQRAIGYSLTGDTREQCLFFLYGTGRNGKSTFIETFKRLMGPLHLKVRSEVLMATRQGNPNPDSPTPTIVSMRGKRVVVATETEDGHRWNEALIKDLTGKDTMTGRTHHKEPINFHPTHKIWTYGNYKPTIRGAEEGIWRRIRLIPFTVTIPEDEQDNGLPDKLARELPGILRWAIEGCLDWQQHGLPAPARVREATQEYREDMDTIGQMIDELCITDDPQAKTRFNLLYQAYESWCQARGETVLGSKRFAEALKHKGFDIEKVGGVVYRRGIKLYGDD